MDTGYVAKALLGVKPLIVNGIEVPRTKLIKVEVELRFEYAGEEFIIHKPISGKKDGFVGSHSGIGFLVSQPKSTNKTNKMESVANPKTYKTADEARRVVIANIDRYQFTVGDIGELIDRFKDSAVKSKINNGYLQLRMLKLI